MPPEHNENAAGSTARHQDRSGPAPLRLLPRDGHAAGDLSRYMNLNSLERYARENPLSAVGVAAALGYIVARSGLGGSPVRATGLVLGATGDLAGGALRGTADFAGETLKGTGSLAAGVVGAAMPLATGALSAAEHVGSGVLYAGRDVTVGTAKAGLKLGGAALALLPAAAALFLLNAYLGSREEESGPAM